MKNAGKQDAHNQYLLDQIAQLQAQVEQSALLLVQKENAFTKQIADQENAFNEQIADQEKQLIAHQLLIDEKDCLLQAQEEEILFLRERLNILLSKRYSAQSEQLKHIQGQLFDEAELEQAIRETEEALAALESSNDVGENTPDDKSDTPSKRNSGRDLAPPKRKTLPAHLRRVDVMIDVDEADKQAMGDDWTLIGYETSEQLAVQQREYFVKAIKRAKYVRKTSSDASDKNASDERADKHISNDLTKDSAHGDSRVVPVLSSSGIKVAPTAKVILPRAIADATLLADILTSKFVDAMSFYRTEKRLQREGVDIGYSTLCDWPIQLHARLKPFERLFYEGLAQSTLWHLDETTLQVLGEPGRKNQQTSYLWGIRAGPPDNPIVLFHYHPRRNYEALSQWLEPCLTDFHGVIVSDEHDPYNKLVEKHANIVGHGGCLAHCRRKFADAAKGRRHTSDAHKALQKIAQIYRQEKTTAHLTGEGRSHARDTRVRPLLDEFKAMLEGMAPKYAAKGAMKTAIGYALNNWHKFTAFLKHAEMPIDNNVMEQAIRPFTIGRKNFLFAGSPRGAQASAFIYSIIESAKANGLEPLRYLTRLFQIYPHLSDDEQRRQLLPWNFQFSDFEGLGQ